jgi:hypothetical protein
METSDAGGRTSPYGCVPLPPGSGLAAVYLALIGFVLEPRSFFAGDCGVKYCKRAAWWIRAGGG